MFGRGSVYRRDSTYNNYFDNMTTGNEFQFLNRAFTFDDVYTFNPTTVMNLRYGYNRFIRGDAGNRESIGLDLTTLGFPAYMNDLISADIRRFPRIDITSYQGTAGDRIHPAERYALLHRDREQDSRFARFQDRSGIPRLP